MRSAQTLIIRDGAFVNTAVTEFFQMLQRDSSGCQSSDRRCGVTTLFT